MSTEKPTLQFYNQLPEVFSPNVDFVLYPGCVEDFVGTIMKSART